jgi:hypothetical protein
MKIFMLLVSNIKYRYTLNWDSNFGSPCYKCLTPSTTFNSSWMDFFCVPFGNHIRAVSNIKWVLLSAIIETQFTILFESPISLLGFKVKILLVVLTISWFIFSQNKWHSWPLHFCQYTNLIININSCGVDLGPWSILLSRSQIQFPLVLILVD